MMVLKQNSQAHSMLTLIMLFYVPLPGSLTLKRHLLISSKFFHWLEGSFVLGTIMIRENPRFFSFLKVPFFVSAPT